MRISGTIVTAVEKALGAPLTHEACVKVAWEVEMELADLRDDLVERARCLEVAAQELAGVPEMAGAIVEMRARARGLRAGAEALVDDGEIPF